MKMKIVRFKNGKYGIRRFNVFRMKHEFKDLKDEYWWEQGSRLMPHCQGSEEAVREVFDMITDKGERV